MKRPGRIDLLIKTILDNTLESDPDYPVLTEQYPKLKKLLLDLDLLIESRQNAELMNLLSKIDPPTEILAAARSNSSNKKSSYVWLVREMEHTSNECSLCCLMICCYMAYLKEECTDYEEGFI